MQVTLTRAGHFADDSYSQQISVEDEPVIIGRSRRADVQVADPWASRIHCELRVRDGMVVVRDLDSAHGTLVNESPVRESSIFPGELLTLGITSFRVTYQLAGVPTPSNQILNSGDQIPYSRR